MNRPCVISRKLPVVSVFRVFALVASVVLTGCDVIVQSIHQDTRAAANDVWTKSYTLAPGGRIDVTNVNGRIEVEAGEGRQVEVRAERTARAATDEAARKLLQQIEIHEEVAGDRLRFETRYPRHSRWEVKYRLRVPADAAVTLQTTNGGIEVVGVLGALKAETTNGGVVGRRVGGAVEAGTTNGGIVMEVDAIGEQGVKLATTNGGIDLRVPQSAKADISARCVNGGIQVSSDLTIEQLAEPTRRRLDARMNGGGARVELETVNGGIKIGRKS